MFPPAEPQEAQPGLLPDRIQAPDYSVKLSLDRLEALGRRVRDEVQRYEEEVSQRRENARAWRRDLELLEADTEGPWPNSAAVRAPYTSLAVSNHQIRLDNMICAPSPAFGVRARKRAALEAQQV